MNNLDHIVVAAKTVEQGASWIQNKLGVDIPPGGVHKTMGTHNHLMQLGGDAYLEVVAINPEGEIPDRPRWFNLDDRLMRASIEQEPRLITWMINTSNIENLASNADFDFGQIQTLSRDQLSWKVALTSDGRLLGGGLIPHGIEWQSKPHPSRSMADRQCRLKSLNLFHNRPQWLRNQLVSIKVNHLILIHTLEQDQSPFLSAEIECPNGLVTLGSSF
ncbi:MAG: hypothetical protein ACI8XC_002585 [Gammaproteobacteria bacterium]|jgi:hypothetical protein